MTISCSAWHPQAQKNNAIRLFIRSYGSSGTAHLRILVLRRVLAVAMNHSTVSHELAAALMLSFSAHPHWLCVKVLDV